ncbi:hypothetical protein GDO81_001327 [Engystomops pustulosus]|uniref:Histone deacetylase interacting domain-containing protein n=1 Tax=Engystomops pustulosus TaxID=76066 RepID=A0AAV7DBD7_ENGPU|nr:hypothetical protein GDO81_001327 [Engystomops pustulosus]
MLGFNAFLPLGYKIELPKNGKLVVQTTLASPASADSASSNMPSSRIVVPPVPENSHSDVVEEPRQQEKEKTTAPPESDSLEFHNAISYVNKIKTRFLDRPEIYRSFLEILHTYQKDQLNPKSRPFRGMSEEEVFTEVANLFRGQEDLLSEFGQFLPEAKRSLFTGNGACELGSSRKLEYQRNLESRKRSRSLLLRPMSCPSKKKMKMRKSKDQSVASVGKYGTLQEFSFFNKVRRVLKSQEVYENFLRCISLFNQELVSGSELLQLVTPFLGKFPELFAQFKSFLGVKELSFASPVTNDRSNEGIGREIDYASCKRIGSSYRALPKTYQQPKCSGRTAVCKEVLNDTWVSFPAWSEDSTFVSSKKTPYEEQLHRCEDERFELDVVLETNLATIRVLESVQKKLSRMSAEDQEKFRLDDCLGGTSEVIQRRAIYRIYGDKAPDIIESLKKNPATAVPVVLKRLKAKEEEWREAQQGFNKTWREQYERAYLKSLDHQAVNFKQNDTKALRSKSLLNEIESVYDEHQEQQPEGRTATSSGPHLIYTYEDWQILEDASSLISYYVKRQPAIQKEDKDTIRQVLHQFIPELFFSASSSSCQSLFSATTDEGLAETTPEPSVTELPERRRKAANPGVTPEPTTPTRSPPEPPPKMTEEMYSLFFANNNWYFFFRLHHTLCSRLLRIYRQAQIQLLEYRTEKEREKLLCEGRKEKSNGPAMELRLKQPSEVELEEYYPAFLDMLHHLMMFLQRQGQVVMTIELLDTEDVQTEDPTEVQHLSNYVEQFINVDEQNSQSEGFLLKPVLLQRNIRHFQRWQCRTMRMMKDEVKSSWKRLMGVESANNMDCRFRLNSHKMMFIVNSEDYMYRWGTLTRAKEFQPMVFQKHHEKFAAWHNSWLQENVSPRAAELVQDWLTGEEDEEMVPCKTICEVSEVHGMTVTRYRVQYTRRASSP